ncbi:hypothetical protein ES332_D02G219700v1 [Gossypium tomentosum]|uniref:Uncharacterized protein n=1 Tax=Gossypium tomentosum TaxID=34277 RepID=A0A5D2M0M6_GOSTO|nr:hypothetical protein ES332_D02G219700v1 [Gossypium tomentosum]
MKRCFLKINKSHEPEVMPIHRNYLNIALHRILFHHHRINTAHIRQSSSKSPDQKEQ